MTEITPQQRSALIVSYLAELADDKLRWLYRWIEDNAVDVARLMMESHYHTFSTLEGDDATYTNFVGRLQALASESKVEAVDVFLHVHGSPQRLWFKGGTKNTSIIGDDLIQLGLKKKLRALYSTACYGENHTEDFIRGGFRVASGALGVNANAVAEYPLFMTNWIGDCAELCKLTWKVTRSALPGKDIVCQGKIKEKVDSEHEKYLICEVTASNEYDEFIASGEAMVVFTTNHAPN